MARFPMHTFQQDAILARLSQALVALEVSNVKTLTGEQCEKLQCGDVVVKKDASGEHSYVVTFKSSTGMCLTYMDASVVETQSYDKVGDNWIYNSEDKTPNLLNVATKTDIESGILSNAKPIYCHPIMLYNGGAQNRFTALIFNNDSTPFTVDSLFDYVVSHDSFRLLTNGIYNGAQTVYLNKSTDDSVAMVYVDLQEATGISAQSFNKTSFKSSYPNIFDLVHKIN